MKKQIKMYKKAGLKLIHMRGKSKIPAAADWPNCRTKYKHWLKGGVGNGLSDNVGIAHNMNGTICLDIDNVSRACELYPDIASVVSDEFCGARYTSGKPNRMKILFKLPPELLGSNFSMITLAEGCGQIRGGESGLQDLLPPSIHPENDSWVYTWENTFTGKVPVLPSWFSSTLLDVMATAKKASVLVDSGTAGAVGGYPFIEVYNRWFMDTGGSLVDAVLELGGYVVSGFGALKRVGSSNRQAVVVYNDPDGIDRCYNFSDTVGEGLLPFGLNDPYSVLSCLMGFDEARAYVCKVNDELRELVDAYEESLIDDIVVGSGGDDSSGSAVAEPLVEQHQHTVYPEQVGAMGKLVAAFMKMHPFITPEIAVVQAHSLVSTLGGRVYTFGQGTGIVWTALVVGRTGRGKSFILSHLTRVISELSYGKLGKKISVGAMSVKDLKDLGEDGSGGVSSLSTYSPVAATYYTSVKNFVADIVGNGSVLSVRTESGQSDKSKAGDMARVRMMELELSTKSGAGGFIAKGGQNDKIPAMYSPACTVIRETVLESTLDVDLEKNVDVAGDTGRRSHVVINPMKPSMNHNASLSFPGGSGIVGKLVSMFSLACSEKNRDVSNRLMDDDWINIRYSDGAEAYYQGMVDKWIASENECVGRGDVAGIAFYSRLYEKVPAWAGRLAIIESVSSPVITIGMIDCAVASLWAEHSVFAKVKASVKSPWDELCERVVEILREPSSAPGSLYTNYGRARERDYVAMAAANAIEWPKLRTVLCKMPCWSGTGARDNFVSLLERKLREYNVFRVPARVAAESWGTRSECYWLRE